MRYGRELLQQAVDLATPPAGSAILADAANQSAASASTSSPTSSAVSPFDINSHFSPTMIIILVILLSAFFFMGFFAVYVRRCTTEESFTRHGSSRRGVRRDDLNPPGSGVDPSLVESYPMVSYVAAKKKGCNECVVCLGDFEAGEELKQLPKCKHMFHPACIGSWLESHTTCPLCRRSLVNSDRWSVSFRWGGSSRGGSLSTRLTGEENSRSRRGTSPWWGRMGSSAGSRISRGVGRNEDASLRGGLNGDASLHSGAQEQSPPCEAERPPVSPSSWSQPGLPVTSSLSEVAESVEVALPASALSSEPMPQGIPIPNVMPHEIQECYEGMPRGWQGNALESDVAASALHGSMLSAVPGPDVASRKPVAGPDSRRLGRSNSAGDSLRRRAVLQMTGCMPFSFDRSRSAGIRGLDDEDATVGNPDATPENAPLSGSRCSASQVSHEVATSTSPVTSASFPQPP